MSNTERRTNKSAEVRVSDPIKGQVVVKPVVYNVTDDYGTQWAPGVFNDYVYGDGRSSGDVVGHTVMAWGHDWTDPIGRMVDFEDAKDAPTAVFQLDDPAEVPRSRQAIAQLRSGTIRSVSVGFDRQKWTNVEDSTDGCVEIMEKAGLPETSLVLSGAVPGAVVTGVRSADAVAKTIVIDMAKFIQAGDMTLAEAEAILGSRDAGTALAEYRTALDAKALAALKVADDEMLTSARAALREAFR